VDAVVMAAGEGRRLRPLTERWPKPVLPIDGRPVVATLLRELRVAGVVRVFVVTGHLAEQVERLVGDGSAFGLELRTVRQPSVLGSADAVQRAVDAGAATPILVSAADTVFRRGDVGRFAEAFGSSGAAGAIAMRRDPPPSPGRPGLQVADGAVVAIGGESEWSAAPLWALDAPVVSRLCVDREPWELENAFRASLAAGERIAAIEIGKTRDLTDPLDLVEENFPYLKR
jgi:N-acetyl-alpha-D-muramate 1-phosphate uridylyltransferase